jgi:hypothetical protein
MEKKIEQSESLIIIRQKYSEWCNNYTIHCRIGLKIFSFIFPSVLRIYLEKD